MFPLSRFLKKLHPLIHRIYLFLKPAYWRLRTPAQKKFDIKLQYIFIGCFIGVLLTALIIPAAHHLISYPTDETQAHFSDLITEEPLSPEKTADLKEISISDNLLLNEAESQISPIALQLNKNETLSGLLTRANVNIADALAASESLTLITDLRKLRPGQSFELYFNEDNIFQGLKMEMRSGEVVSTFKNKNGDFIPQSKEGKIETRQISLEGVIQSSFAAAAKEAGAAETIELKCAADLQDAVLSSLGASAKIVKVKSSGVVIKAKTVVNEDFYAQLIKWGGVKLSEPSERRKEFKKYCKKIISQYK